MKTYIARVHKDADSSFGVSFPDLPGCYATGETREQALEAAKISLREYAEALREDGEMMPPPQSFDDAVAAGATESVEIGMAASVWVEIPLIVASKSKRANVSLDENLLEAIDQHARIAGVSRSALLSRAMTEWLARTVHVVTAPKSRRKPRLANA